MINVEVEKNSNENSLSLIRRFSKKVQGSGILPRLRGARYATRNISENVKKKKTLKKLARKEEILKLLKLGKMPVNEGRK